MLILLLVGAGLLALSKSNMAVANSAVAPVPVVGTGGAILAPPDPGNQTTGIGLQKPRNWPPLAGQPGWVTIGGKPAPTGYHGGSIEAAMQVTGFGGVAVGLTSGVAQGISAITGSAILPGLGAALPLIGAGIAVVGVVLGIISRHHAAAVAHEAQVLEQATPVLRQRQVLICQAAIMGEINYQQATQLVQQCIADFYTMVKGIQRGTWHWDPSYADSSAGFKVGQHSVTWGMDQKSPNAHAPSVCNAACWYAHFSAEGDCYTILLPTIQKILAGQHGVMALPVFPSDQAIQGYPEVDVLY